MSELDGLLLDIDGVLVVSWEPIEGAAGTLAELRRRDVPIRFVTNTTSASRREVAARLDRVGMPVASEEILSAPSATAAWIKRERPGASCYLINSGDLGDDLADLDLAPVGGAADLVVLGGAGPEFSYEQMNHALGLLLDGAELVGMHRNRYWKTRDGYSLDTGAYLTALEQASGVSALVMGKPSPDFFLTGLAELGLPARRVAMVGDDIENDVLAAQDVGVTGILVRTGKYRPSEVNAQPGDPDHVIESFTDLAALL
ncbi:MAG: TIGR01458 family HAD-type hydrolase [Acidimicrobiales bacterium]